jgi:osmotically-inducible protein OsmY
MLLKLARLSALIFAACAAASCATTPRSPKQLAADRATQQRVLVALDSQPYYYFQHVSVRVDDGVATLAGYVWTPEALVYARQVTRRVPGVTRVVSNDLDEELSGRRAR